jgi:hypothetical protein
MIASPTLSNVIIVGGSGNMGKIILDALQSAPDINVTALARPNSVATFLPEVKVVRAEYTVPELAKVFQGQDAVISAVGAAGIAEQQVLVDAAIEAGVKRFLPSEFSANTLPDKVRGLVPVFQPKMDLLDYLKEKESTGLSWTGLAVGPLFDWVRLLHPSQIQRNSPTNTPYLGYNQRRLLPQPYNAHDRDHRRRQRALLRHDRSRPCQRRSLNPAQPRRHLQPIPAHRLAHHNPKRHPRLRREAYGAGVERAQRYL